MFGQLGMAVIMHVVADKKGLLAPLNPSWLVALCSGLQWQSVVCVSLFQL